MDKEILTKDKVNLRLNLAANWRYGDALLAFGQLTKTAGSFTANCSFALREAVVNAHAGRAAGDKRKVIEMRW